jgi:hypothetical protein
VIESEECEEVYGLHTTSCAMCSATTTHAQSRVCCVFVRCGWYARLRTTLITTLQHPCELAISLLLSLKKQDGLLYQFIFAKSVNRSRESDKRKERREREGSGEPFIFNCLP